MAFTDTWAFYGLFVFFLCLGVLLPFINEAFDSPSTEHDTSGLPTNESDLGVDAIEILLSVLTVFFWTFGQVNFFVDLVILLPLRILAVYLFARMIRGN